MALQVLPDMHARPLAVPSPAKLCTRDLQYTSDDAGTLTLAKDAALYCRPPACVRKCWLATYMHTDTAHYSRLLLSLFIHAGYTHAHIGCLFADKRSC